MLGAHRQFYVNPQLRRFTSAAAVVERLRLQAEATSLQAVHHPSELQLNDEGKTREGGYRYSAHAFSRVTRLASNGLGSFLGDLNGDGVQRDAKLVSGPMALQIFNRVVELRFPLFQPQRLMRCTRTRTIDGLVGPGHQLLENQSCLQLATEAATAKGYVFCGAILVGRRLAVWFRDTSPLFKVEWEGAAYPFYAGLYASNLEATGDSVHITCALFTKDGVALGPFTTEGGRIRHAGPDFTLKVEAAFQKAIQPPPVDRLKDAVATIQRTRLGFCQGESEKTRRRQSKQVQRTVASLGLPKSLAVEAVQEAMYQKRTTGPLDVPAVLRKVPQRTVFDLFLALQRIARRLDLDRQEAVSQAAYRILRGEYSPKE